MLQIFYCKMCFQEYTEYACNSKEGLRCTNCCGCENKIEGDGPVNCILNNKEIVWNTTHEPLSNIYAPIEVPDPPENPEDIILEDIINDPTSPSYIGGGL
jgi:hypothetical protein